MKNIRADIDAKIMEKIEKLMRLSRSSNPHEASLALSRVQALMKQHGMSGETIAIDGDGIHARECHYRGAQKPQRWVNNLICLVSSVCGVSTFLSLRTVFDPRTIGYRPQHVVIFFGPAGRERVAGYVYEVLMRQAMSARRAFLAGCRARTRRGKTAAADAFCEGWVTGAREVVTEFEVTDHERERMENWKTLRTSGKPMNIVTMRKPPAVHGARQATSAGYQKGRQVKLNRGLNGEEQRRLMYNGEV